VVEAGWNATAHAQKPDFVFRRNGRVHLNRVGRQFSRLLAAEVCASAVVILDTPCSEVVWRVQATHSIRQFPLHFHSGASPCAITFQLESSTIRCLGNRIRVSALILESLYDQFEAVKSWNVRKVNIVVHPAVWSFSSQGISSGRGGGGGGAKEDTLIGSYTELQKTPSFILVDSMFYRAHTVCTHRCIEYLRMNRVDNDFLVSVPKEALPNFKVRLESPDCRVEADWLQCAARQMQFTLFGQPISNLSHDPRTPATTVATRSNSQSERHGRWLADAKLYK